MATSQADWGASVMGSVRHGVVALLARRVAQAAASWPPWDLVLACVALLSVARCVQGPLGVSRLAQVLTDMVRAVLFGAVLQAVASDDPALDAPTMLGGYLLLDGLDAAELGGSVRYRVAERVSEALSRTPDLGLMLAVALLSTQSALASAPRLRRTAAMASVGLVTQYVASVTPAGLELPTTLLLLFLCHPKVRPFFLAARAVYDR